MFYSCFLHPPLQIVRDSDLFRLVGALVFVDVLLMVIWMTLHPPSRKVLVQTDGTQTVRIVKGHEVDTEGKKTY